MRGPDDLRKDVDRQFRRASRKVSMETKQHVNRRLTDLRPKIHAVCREDGYEDHLIDSIQREKERFQLYRRFQNTDVEDGAAFLADTPYDEFRTQPVCTCDGKHAHRCPIKLGRLPREIRDADTIDAGIRDFQGVHGGRPLALLDAQDTFAEKQAAVEEELRTCLAILSTDEIPEDDDAVADDAARNGDVEEQPAD
jgi:hypothetical protein